MRNLKVVAALILSCTAASGIEAQGIGGLIKRKAADAVKPKNEPEAKAKDAAEPASPFPFDLTPETMAGFKRGLELEIKMMEDYRARLAKLKTPKEYEACTKEALASNDGMKIIEEYGQRSEKVKTPADMQELTTWQNNAFNAMLLKRCGEDPAPLIQQQKQEFTNAQRAGAIEFGKSWTKPPRREEPASNRERDNTLEECTNSNGTIEGESTIPSSVTASCFALETAEGMQDDNAAIDVKVIEYERTKELLKKYCSLSPEMRADAEKNGIRVPGTGKDIYWVFSRAFAIWVGPDCDHLMKLYSMVTR